MDAQRTQTPLFRVVMKKELTLPWLIGKRKSHERHVLNPGICDLWIGIKSHDATSAGSHFASEREVPAPSGQDESPRVQNRDVHGVVAGKHL